jgi:hypothetical protein
MVEFAIPTLYQVSVIPFIVNHLGDKSLSGKRYHFYARIVLILLKLKNFESTEETEGELFAELVRGAFVG